MEDTQKNPGASATIAGSFSSREHISPRLLHYHAMLSAPCSLWHDPFNILERCWGCYVIFIRIMGLPVHNFCLTRQPWNPSWMWMSVLPPLPSCWLFPDSLKTILRSIFEPTITLSQPFYSCPTLRLTQSCRAGRIFLSSFKFEYTWFAPYQKIQFSHISIIPETEKWAHTDTFMSKSNPQTSFLSLATKAVMWHSDSKTGLWNVCLFLISDLL